ncbi:hypothetical protein SAMN05444678_11754 [Sphingomonas sp. YR710]|jgi:predicted nucleotidyltransferase|uniref:nucleotidyltransferase domain-containing protein n=1 Tax=Sphingomonas sp. YR710 TaxID=1882773 RepID=UPI0008812EF4|nr:nucleotidyltransferase domain-containing protein [Sphingomonas sp. YR710]SDD61804.1 hypothetical protein SAMN05444678_11754 [Sphingomonas sp. YR710]
MRLKPDEVDAINAAAREAFGPDAVVRLFGSRVDDSKRGGDIDLIVEVEDGQQDIVHESRFLDALFARIDERKVDLLFMVRGSPPSAFAQMVAREAVLLS